MIRRRQLSSLHTTAITTTTPIERRGANSEVLGTSVHSSTSQQSGFRAGDYLATTTTNVTMATLQRVPHIPDPHSAPSITALSGPSHRRRQRRLRLKQILSVPAAPARPNWHLVSRPQNAEPCVDAAVEGGNRTFFALGSRGSLVPIPGYADFALAASTPLDPSCHLAQAATDAGGSDGEQSHKAISRSYDDDHWGNYYNWSANSP